MELKAYLRTLASKWQIALLTFLITYAATLALTYTQTPMYQSRAAYVMKLSDSFETNKDLVSAVDILSRRTEIATTYTLVANSGMIEQQAANALGLTSDQRRELTVSSQLIPGTNVVEIVAQARDPVLARDFTNMVGAKTMVYVRDLYATYRLELLDMATASGTPVKPNKPLNLLLGATMGLALGAGMAFLSAYLQAAPENAANVDVFDHETGTYSRRYFLLRLRQELSRARRSGRLMSVALVDIDHQRTLANSAPHIRQEALRRVMQRLLPRLRNEDTMARFDETVFAILWADTSGEGARQATERLCAAINKAPLELEQSGVLLDLRSSAGVAAYPNEIQDEDLGPEEMIERARQALDETAERVYGKVALFTEDEAPQRWMRLVRQ